MAISADVPVLTPGGGGRRPVLHSARVALEALAHSGTDRLWVLGDDEVAAALGALSEVVAGARAQFVAVLAEATSRSLGAGQGWGAVDWVRAVAPSTPTRDLLDAQVVASVLAEGVRPDGADHRLDAVVDAVLEAGSGDAAVRRDSLSVGKAAQICRFHRGVRGMADADGLAATTADLVLAARGVGGLSEARLAVAIRHAADVARPDGAVEREAQVRRDHRSLVKGPGPVGMSRYTLILDEEGSAVVDAAVDALAKPRRDEDTGVLDTRTPAARRADALLDLVSRATSSPDGVPRQAKTSVVVTVSLEALEGRARGAGLTTGDEMVTVGVVRRWACDAQVVPVVLGARGEVLDQGTARRLFDRAQIRHLWLRDKHCTFPGCSKPAAWTDAHHLVHWVDGGATDIDNAALLCRAHHTAVHQHRYAGRVAGPGETGGPPRVVWDLAMGSYDHDLHQQRQQHQQRGRTLSRPVPATG